MFARGRTSPVVVNPSAMRHALLLAVLVQLVGCGAGPYGHSRTYEPLGAEASAARGADEYDPVMSRRQPEEWQKKKVTFFGVVTERKDVAGGRAEVVLSVRTLASRNLCESQSDDSCRTTV